MISIVMSNLLMMIYNKKNMIVAATLIVASMCFKSYSQKYANPVNVPIALSANFGELRANHFHSGLDYKTQQVINKPILSVADGNVSRISVSPGGYGLALYVNHEETGHTTVYGHLDSFADNIAEYVNGQQYELETYRIELYPPKEMFPVKRGQQIALSGNTGSSGGPHLHFEVRDTKSQDPLDPFNYFGNTVTDTQKPDLRGIAFYPIHGKGSINDSSSPLRLDVAKNAQGVPLALGQTIRAWGRIGVGVKAYDKMNGQANIYGVKHVRLYVDENQVFSQTIDRYSFADTRMLNTLIDYEDWKNRKSFYMRSFVTPGNKLKFYDTTNDGFIDINEERNYRLRYELEDYHGNTLVYSFVVVGKKQPIEKNDDTTNYMSHNFHNTYVDTDFVLDIQRDNLYEDIHYLHNRIDSKTYYSDIFQVHNTPVPLHNNAKMWIQINNDTLLNKHQYGVVDVSTNMNWVGGVYKNGGVEASIRELGGRYAISVDNVPPVITPVNPNSWMSNKKIEIRLRDNLSGIAQFRGTINGEFVLFKHDVKSSIYTYVLDRSRLPKGDKLVFVFTAKDGANNVATYEHMLVN